MHYPGPAGRAHSAAADSLAELRGGEEWQRKMQGEGGQDGK